MRKPTVKYLGLHIDETLKFSSHLSHVKAKLSQICGLTYRIRENLNFHSAKLFYFSFVFSTIKYGISAWGGILQCTRAASKLSDLQSKIIRNLFSKFFPGNLCLFKTIKLLKIPDIHRFYVSVHMFKLIILNSAEGLSLDINYPNHDHFTRNNDRIIPNFPRVAAIRISHTYQFASVWNDLPSNLKEQTTLKAFKRELSNYFLRQY